MYNAFKPDKRATPKQEPYTHPLFRQPCDKSILGEKYDTSRCLTYNGVVYVYVYIQRP